MGDWQLHQDTLLWVKSGVVLLAGLACLGLLSAVLSPFWMRFVVNRAVDHVVRQMFGDPYTKNLLEGVTALQRFGVRTTIENELRAHIGKTLDKPIGSTRHFPNFDGLLFSPAPVAIGALDMASSVDVSTVIGAGARRPLRIALPVMVSAMGYGVALNKSFARALAKGATLAGTAYNVGQGPAVQGARDLAEHLVVQYHGASWRPSESLLQVADMIEIRLGQGANAGCGTTIPTKNMSKELLREFGAQDVAGDSLYIPAGIPGVHTVREARRLVEYLRKLSRGAPIAVKIAAGQALERDLMWAIKASVDVIVIDGAQGGTHGSPAIVVDDFGIPTLHALCRAVPFVRAHQGRRSVDIVISGGIRTPGDMLKAIALGAKAVYIGTAALFAATHLQITKAIPFEPPTQVAWENGKVRQRFNEDKGAQSLAQFLNSCADEMRQGLRAVGKPSLHLLSEEDLVAWQPEVARITGRPLI